jgi:DNA-binding NarL/FixJ family response regulator
MMKKKINIVIIDDHKLFVEGLRSIFEKDDEIEIVNVYYSGKDFVNDYSQQNFDILILDLKIPDFNGFQILQFIRDKKPEIDFKVIVLSTFSDEETVGKCKELGAQAFLLKITGQNELKGCIKEVFENDVDFLCDSQIKLTQSNAFSFWEKKYKISKREWEIMKLLALNFTSQQIAAKLIISIFTVDTHRKNILYKLSVKNTTALIQKMLTEC